MVLPRHEGDHATTEMEMNMGMDGHSHSSSSMHMAVFQNDPATPLYSEAWAPGSAGAYAGTIIFLIILGIVLRLLLAAKALAEARWLDQELKRRYIVVGGGDGTQQQQQPPTNLSEDSLAQKMAMTENGAVEEQQVVVVQKRKHRTPHARPWRLSVDPVRALLDTCLAGVGYLLMLAVMTMNVGYFMAVLAGTFLGSLFVGRYNQSLEGGH